MDLRGSLFFHLHRISYTLHCLTSTAVTRIVAWMKDVKLGKGFMTCGIPYFYRTPHSKIQLSDNCRILNSFKSNHIGSMTRSRLCTLTPTASIMIGKRVGMSAVTISAHESISIGDDTQIGAGTIIVDSDFHNVRSIDVNERHHSLGPTSPVIIGKNVFIGTRCTILKGVTIGDNAVIGANSVVTKNIPDNAIAAGNPIHIIRTLDISQSK